MGLRTKFKKNWKSLWRKIMSLDIAQWIVAILMSFGIWLVYFTSRKKVINKHLFKEYSKKPAIFIFWHGRSMMLSAIVWKYNIKGYAVSSMHRDGRLMAKLQRLFGLKPIYGSPKEGAVSALRHGVRKLREGKSVCLSPDGPKGPRMRLKDGFLYFAKMSGAPIIPVCYGCSKSWFQKRWDKYLIALPFSKIECRVMDPIFVPSKMTDEQFEKLRKDLENKMIKQLQDLDSRFGYEKMQPEAAR